MPTDRHDKLVLSPDRLPWEKQPYETMKGFQAFVVYRDLLWDRSLEKVAEALGKGDGQIGTWSSKNLWVERSDAYLEELDRRYRERRESEVEMDATVNAEAARLIQRKAAARLTGEDPELGITGIAYDALDAGEALALWTAATRTRRLETGQATDIAQQMNQVSKGEALAMLEGLYDTLMRHVPVDGQARAAADVQMFFGRGRPLS